jgi:hypothetical protein
MKRLIVGFGIGTVLAYAWRHWLGDSAAPQPSWEGTDTPSEEAALDEELTARATGHVAEPEPPVETAGAETPATG